MRLLAILLSSLLLCSCVAPYPASQRLQTFSEAEYRANLEDGTSAIFGEAFLTTRGGGVHYGAGHMVQLIPSTPYTTEVFERQFINHERMATPVDKRLDNYMRTTTAGSRGEFRFDHVPAGSYYLICSIFWEVPRVNQFNRYDVYYEETGDTALGRVTVGEGEQKRVVLTR